MPTRSAASGARKERSKGIKIIDYTLKLNTKTYQKSRGNYIDIRKNLVYISYTNPATGYSGRIYFMIDSPQFKKTIKNMQFDEAKWRWSFNWVGDWDTATTTKIVVKKFVFTFNKERDFHKVKNVFSNISS